MGEIQVTTTVAASPETVFDHLHRPELMKKWMGGFVRAEPETEDPVAVGARSRDIFEENGKTIEMQTEVTEFESPRVLAASVDGPGVVMASRFELEPASAGTRVTQTATSMWKMPYRLLGPAMTTATRKRMQEDLDRLRGLFEGDD